MTTIIFDFDGTIADTAPLVAKAIRENAARFGYHVPDFSKLRSKHAFSVLTKEMGIPAWKIPYLFWKGKKIVQKDLKKAKIFPGMVNVLRRLQKSHPVMILTSNRKDTVEAVLRRYQLSVPVVSGSLFRKDRSLQRLLWKLHQAAGDVLYVGDELRDIDACRRVGVRMIGVAWGYNTAEALSEAGVPLAKKPQDILSFIEKEERSLAAYRRQIEVVDKKLIVLLVQRLKIAEELGEMKRRQSLLVQDKQREKELQKLWEREFSRWGYPSQSIRKVMVAILSLSKRVMKERHSTWKR